MGTNKEDTPNREEEKIPLGQVLFDELFLFFLLSLVLSFMLYNVWGMLDLLRTPVFTP